MLLFHQVCHSSKIYKLIDGLKLENGILKVGSNESDVFACLSTISFPWIPIYTGDDKLMLLLTFCLLLLPLWEPVIVLCFVVRCFVSILVLQSS